MMKAIIQRFFILFFYAGCVIQIQADFVPASLAWSKKLNGAISGISLSRDEKVILVATSVDKEIDGRSRYPLLSRFNTRGTRLWQISLKSPVRDLDLDEKGNMIVISNYQNELIAFNAQGKKRWSVDVTCRPFVVDHSKSIFCYHDDDAQPQVAFDVFDWNGKKKVSFPIESDALGFKLSKDQKNVILFLADNRIILIDSKGQKTLENTIDGDVIDVSVSSGNQPRLAILSKDKNKKQKVLVFDSQFKSLGSFPLQNPGYQIEFSSSNEFVFYSSNTQLGQEWGGFSVPSSDGGVSWKASSKIPSEYSYPLLVTFDTVLMGREGLDLEESAHILAYGHSGVLKWDLDLKLNAGDCIQLYKVSGSASFLVAGTEYANINFYRVLNKINQ